MKRLWIIFAVVLATLLVAPTGLIQVAHADVPPLIITEIKVRNDTVGLDEFIELYNPSTEPVSLNDYFIGYINSPAPAADQTFATSVIGDGLLAAGESFVLAKNETDPNLSYSKKSPFSSLSDSGGTLRITDAQDVVIDQFAWTSTTSIAISPIQLQCTASSASCNANKTQSFSRSYDADGNYVLVNPAWPLGSPTPQSIELLPLAVPDPDPEPLPDPTPDGTDTTDGQVPSSTETPEETPEVPNPATALPPQITELLPNPASPASDSTDEYIELYNPNDQPINLLGFRLQSGNTFSYSYTFASSILGSHEYKAFMVTETGNILSNSSGQVRLLDPAGVVVAQTNAYDTANDGDSWAFINGAWQWTTTITPNAANVLTLSVLKVAATKTATAKKASTSKAPAKKATAKTAAAKTTKPARAAAERAVYEDPDETIASIHPSILAGVGLITLVYAAYEYRYDVVNRLQQFRRNRDLRRAARTAAKG